MEPREIREKIDEGYVRFTTILEMMGKPKDHAEQTLKDYVAKIKENEDFIILTEDFEDATELEDGMFTMFVELDVLAKTAEHLLWFCFDYMPSSIEIVDPEIIKHTSQQFTGYLNDLQTRLHSMDMVVKRVNATNQKLNSNVEALLKNSIKLSLVTGGNTLAQIADNLGVPENDMANILNQLLGTGAISKDGEIYSYVDKKK